MDTSNNFKRPAEAAVDKDRLQQETGIDCQTARDQLRLMDTCIDCKRPAETAFDMHRLLKTSRYSQKLTETAKRQSEINGYY